MSDLKTQPTKKTAAQFISEVEHPTRRADCEIMLGIMTRVTGHEPVMWGEKIIGYGQYHYKYDSGREGDYLRTGFSPRTSYISVYIMPGYTDFGDILARLGKHKKGKSCLNINKLADVDLDVLEELIRAGFDDMDEKYPS